MQKKEALILENELLKKKLALAQAWIQREVAHHRKFIGEELMKKSQRKKLDNILERETVDIIVRRIHDYFGKSLENAPKHTLEHLVDAEIYWQTLQKFPTLDALPIVSSYQKILDAFFEKILEGFRESFLLNVRSHSDRSLDTKTLSFSSRFMDKNCLDRDIENVLKKKYTLSLGRWYQFFSLVRDGSILKGVYEPLLLAYLVENHEQALEICITEPFFSSFSELVSLEVFGRKRHDTKVSYGDAKRVREICLPISQEKSILRRVFTLT